MYSYVFFGCTNGSTAQTLIYLPSGAVNGVARNSGTILTLTPPLRGTTGLPKNNILLTMSNLDTYTQQAMDIAHDKEQSIFQQREEFKRFLQTVIEESKDKLLKEIATRRRDDEMEDLRYTPPM